MSISVTTSSDFSKTFKYLGKLESFKKQKLRAILQKYGELGVKRLQDLTPKDTGETASRWSYTIEDDGKKCTLSFLNDAQNNGIPIAILIQYGHGTGTGGYVPPNDYINPAMEPVFKQIANDAWKEVRAL